MDNFYFTSFIINSILILRIQIRAIYRLAKSAESFGRGKKIEKFKPEGALGNKICWKCFFEDES